MTIKTLDYCALEFLNLWLEKEAALCEQLNSEKIKDQSEALKKAGAYFKVARNLPRKYDEERGLYRCEPVLNIVNKIPTISTESMVQTVQDVSKKIADKYKRKSAISLASKFLWLKFKSPVRIYDSQARMALESKRGDYLAFNEAYSKRYDRSEAAIVEACERLERVAAYSAEPGISKSRLNDLVSARWFRERVLDIYLWHEGQKSKIS